MITTTITTTIMNVQNDYSLDTQKVLKLMGLEFKDDFSCLVLSKEKLLTVCLVDRKKLISEFMTVLDSSTNKGFLPRADLNTFPIISEILPCFISGGAESERLEYIHGALSMESYKWLYNLLLLQLYQICIDSLTTPNLKDEKPDVVIDLEQQSQEIYSRLDPSIRHHLQKRGISVKENVYIGFDTEFKNQDLVLNTLVSAQLAVSTKTYLLIPNKQNYRLSIVDDKSNMLQKISTKSTVFNYAKLEMSIQMSLNEVRRLKYGNNDGDLLVLNECLKMIKGLSYFEKEDFTIFSLPRSVIQPYIQYGDAFSLKELIEISSGIAKPHLDKNVEVIMSLLRSVSTNKFNLLDGKDKLIEDIFNAYGGYKAIEELSVNTSKPLSLISNCEIQVAVGEKRLTRQIIQDLFRQRISITKSKLYYIIAHLTPADLSMLSDFSEIKEELSIVNGSFVTIGKPLTICGRNVHVRDTMLLAPGGSKSLASIGFLYGELFHKVSISKEDLEDMSGFLNRDRARFTEYALRDALISLVHACWMEDFNNKIGKIGIPLSLSSIGRGYVKALWTESKYQGYQVSAKYLLGDVSKTITPKGMNVIQNIGFALPYYTANYKGGRNECFRYGIDRSTNWIDYDLISAYTTVMSMAGHPEYKQCRRITVDELNLLTREEMLYSYLAIKTDFEFPSNTKYPSIPCFVDENCTVYPLTGSGILTGAEYLLGLIQGCKFQISEIYYTPFRSSEYKDCKPFTNILNFVQEQRREHEKGTVSNLMYKEIGNSIYGSVVRGIASKMKFDIKSKGTVRMKGDELTNPLIASWTTAFVRSIIGECLHSIQVLEGQVVSVTTDGFITDVVDLESKITSNFLLGEFKKIRGILSGADISLEVKSSGKGIVAWTTRGQIGFESKILATTGFQNRNYRDKGELRALLIKSIKTEDKTIEFVQSSLRSATEIYKTGGHVTMQYRDQLFRLHYDNRRVLLWETTIPPTIECLIESNPLQNVKQGENLRFISQQYKKKIYGRYTSVSTKQLKYKDVEEVVVRNFLKALLATPPLFNLNRYEFYSYRSIQDYIENYNPRLKISATSLSWYKIRKVTFVKVEKTKETEAFVNYVLLKFKNFDVESFYNKTGKNEK